MFWKENVFVFIKQKHRQKRAHIPSHRLVCSVCEYVLTATVQDQINNDGPFSKNRAF